jgi:hypothetical protein
MEEGFAFSAQAGCQMGGFVGAAPSTGGQAIHLPGDVRLQLDPHLFAFPWGEER